MSTFRSRLNIDNKPIFRNQMPWLKGNSPEKELSIDEVKSLSTGKVLLYVITLDNKLHIAKVVNNVLNNVLNPDASLLRGLVNHSGLARYRDVYAAGMMTIKAPGKIYIDDCSGHYKPESVGLEKLVLDKFKEFGFAHDEIVFEAKCNPLNTVNNLSEGVGMQTRETKMEGEKYVVINGREMDSDDLNRIAKEEKNSVESFADLNVMANIEKANMQALDDLNRTANQDAVSRPAYDDHMGDYFPISDDGKPVIAQSKEKKISPSEFKKLLAQQGVSADKITEIIKQANQPLHDQLNDLQLKLDKWETQKDYALAFQGLDKFGQTIAKIGYQIQSKELVLFGGGVSSISEIGSGLSMLGYFSSGAAAEIGMGATIMGAASVFTGVVGLGFAVLNYCMKEEESDALGEALQVINQKLGEVTNGINDIKDILYSGFRQLSEMMLYLSKGLEHLSEQQRQTFELARRGFQTMQSTLHEMRAENRLFHKRILEDLDYLTYKVESKELSQHKQSMQECIDSIKFHLQEEKVDVQSVQENLFKLRSKINSLSTKEVNGAAEYFKLKDNPRQAATFILRRLMIDDSALGFLAEEFESITGVNLAKKGVKKEKLFATGLWNESVNAYLQLALEPNCLPISDKSLDEIAEQSENARKFMYEMGRSNIFDKLYERHEQYLHELQLLILSRMNARRKSTDKEQKHAHSKEPVKQMLKDYFSKQDLEVLDNLLDKIDYNYVLANRFADLGGFKNKEEIVSAFENRQSLLKKPFNFYETPTRTVTQYCDYLEPVALPTPDPFGFTSPMVGYTKPPYNYDNANLESIGGNGVKIDGKEHLVFISTGIIAPGSHASFPSGRVQVTLNLYDVTSNKVAATFGNDGYPGHTPFLPVPVTYKLDTSHNANWAWGEGHTVTLPGGTPCFVLFTGGSGHVAMWDLKKQEAIECDNSKPFAFNVTLPTIAGGRGRAEMLKSNFTMTSRTDVLFNKFLIVYHIDWQQAQKVILKLGAYDLVNRKRIDKNFSGLQVDKEFLTSPNQMFFQSMMNWPTSNLIWGALIPGESISVMFAGKKVTKDDLSPHITWSIYETVEIPIEAKAINQVRCEMVNSRLLITASISTGNNSNKLICMYGLPANNKNELEKSFEYFVLDLPEICTIVNGQEIGSPMIHSVADWQTMRTAVFEMGGRSYVIATMLDPTYTPLVFLIDPFNKQIRQLANGPQIQFKPSGLHDSMRFRGFDPYLTYCRKGSPGQFPVNGYSIHVSELDGMLTLYFSYANSNLAFVSSGSVQTTPYLLTPHVKSELDPWLIVDCQKSDKETPDNELGQVLVNIQTLINLNKKNRSKKSLSLTPLTETLEQKPFSFNEHQMVELSKMMDDDVWFMYHQLIEIACNLQKTKTLNSDLFFRFTKLKVSIDEYYKLFASNNMHVESVLNLLRDMASAFNIVNVHFKMIEGHKHTFAKQVSVIVRKLEKFVDKIERNIADQNSKLSVRTHSMFSPGRGFTPRAETILRGILMTLGPLKPEEVKQTATQDKTKLQELNTFLATQGMKVKEISRDGNCFYKSVADHLNQIPKEEISTAKELQEILNKDETFTHEKLREIAVDHIFNNRKFYQRFISGDMNKFASDSVQQGNWAEDIMSHALARALNINLIIINSDGTTPIVIKRENAICTVSLGYEVGTHYNGLEVIDGNNDTVGRYLRDLLDAAPIDDFVGVVNKPSNLAVAKVA